MSCWRGVCRVCRGGGLSTDSAPQGLDSSQVKTFDELERRQVVAEMTSRRQACDLQELKEDIEKFRISMEKAQKETEEASRPKSGHREAPVRVNFVTVAEGKGHRKPQPGGTVKVRYCVVLERDESLLEAKDDFEYVVGESLGEVCSELLDGMLVQMRRGQVASVTRPLKELYPSTAPILAQHGPEEVAVCEVSLLHFITEDHSVLNEVRTTADGALEPSEAMERLRAGNARFVQGTPIARTSLSMRTRLVDEGQAPYAAILGCADSRAPIEKVFDAMPGDIFVLRNAGNTCTHAEGSMVGSLEFATGKLGSRLILVLGHTKCGAINGATQTYLDAQSDSAVSSSLEGLLRDLMEVAEDAASDLGSTDFESVAKHAVKVNVFHSMKFLLKYSKTIRDLVSSGKVELQGGIYNLETGHVDFLGKHPEQDFLFGSKLELPPSMFEADGPTLVRTTESSAVSPFEALKILEEGNKRYVMGAPGCNATQDMRKALVDKGQAPHAAIVGCSDSRAPIETVFDAMPGDLFVLRNAGNTCTHAEGSTVGSLEFCVGKLGSRLILVMGHTSCGAINGATKTYLADKTSATRAEPSCALEGLLFGLTKVARDASEELGQEATEEQLAAHAVKVNVFHSMNFLLKFSQPIRDLVAKGELEIQGAVYNLESGHVQFLGRSPQQDELLSSKMYVPPSVAGASDSSVLFGRHGVRTPEDPPLPGPEALKLLKEGNLRFAKGAPEAGKVDAVMRKALATVGQQPHSAVLGCADSRVPLELVFDTLPGDLFVLRNAGNTCVHSEGSVLGSLEFCVGALNTKLILILGHTNCGAIKGATSQYLTNKGKTAVSEPTNALGALLTGLSDVAQKAEKELGTKGTTPSEKEISDAAVKVNVFKSMDFLIDNSPVVGAKVRSGEVMLQGGIYDLDTGRVQWLGESPYLQRLKGN